MIKAAIMEDDLSCAYRLENLLKEWARGTADVEITVITYADGEDFISDYGDDIRSFDIIFIDIKLGDIDGVEIAKKLRSMEYGHTIVFTTNLENRVWDGYSVQAFNFYVKPIMPRHIKECMDYIVNKNANDYLQFTYHGVTNRIAWEQIIYIESAGHYIDIHLLSGEIVHIKCLLKEVHKQCPTHMIRCQRSYIVNSRHIMERIGNKLLLRGNEMISISYHYSTLVADAMKNCQK